MEEFALGIHMIPPDRFTNEISIMFILPICKVSLGFNLHFPPPLKAAAAHRQMPAGSSGISLPLGFPSKTIGLLAADDPAACAKYVVIIRC
ncbi:hypothetical protein N2597_03985 [Rhizobium sophoriradicis]|uniref:hypothetical protein n=1 Tax=Rhizobium sophoriradicis TaxID=1535245 RepID=UPI00160AF371|nr:hypothetical protein N2597_03985 [Rhizobium leguminosarum bv. phaseoli]